MPEPPSSRSVASIVAGNVFTLFNAILGAFFVLMLALGLFADALFGFIAVINSAIGIRQELKAKETLDQLALLVAPRAKAVRDGEPIELRAEEVVPGDLIRVEPGDQLVADGVVVSSRGLTLDESILTGESEGVSKRDGDRLLSGAFCLAGSGYYEVDAVRERQLRGAGRGRSQGVPPSTLAASGRGQPRAERDHDRDGAARGARCWSRSRSATCRSTRRLRPRPPAS